MPRAQAKISRFELAAHGEVGRPAEEILAEIDLAGLRRGGLARSKVVTWNISPAPSQSLAGDDRRVDVKETLSWKKSWIERVRRSCGRAHYGAEGVGARPQMGDGAQELEGMALLLERVSFRIGRAVKDDAAGVDLGGLSLGRAKP